MPPSEELSPLVAPPSTVQAVGLTEAFYAWELYGRGWYFWEYPVALEPPFRPFFHYAALPQQVVDDGRRPTFLSSVAERLRSLTRSPAPAEPVALPPHLYEEPVPEIEISDEPLTELWVSLPADHQVHKEVMEHFLVGLTYARYPISFEVVGCASTISVGFSCRVPDQPHLSEQLMAHVPEAVIKEEPNYVRGILADTAGKETTIVDFGLSHEFMLPLLPARRFDIDPLISVAGSLSDLASGEVGLLQVLFQAVRNPWAESIIRSVTDGTGGSFFANAPEVVPLAKEKVANPLFAVVLRVAGQSPEPGRSWDIAQALGSALVQFSRPGSNELIPLENETYPHVLHFDDVLNRVTHRSGMILNTSELASFVHLPDRSVRSEKLLRVELQTKAAPAECVGHSLVLGENTHHGRTQLVTLSPEQRMQHTHIIGASGTGKSTLLANLIVQDIDLGQGVAVLDPHGDLIDDILGRIPEERFPDVVLFDPSDKEFPIGFNILKAHSEVEKNLLESDFVAVFRRLSTSWGDQMTAVLGNTVTAFLESSKGGTLVDLQRFLADGTYRREFLSTVHDPEVLFFWEKTFPLLKGYPQAPLLTRLNAFLRPKLIRNMVAQRESPLDFGAIMNEGKIFLAKLSQGRIGEENAHLLGTLVVSKFHQLAIARQDLAVGARRDFYCYIDEFQHFATPSMAAIVSGVRKYRLGLVLAHQDLGQLRNAQDVASEVIANSYTRICFRVGDDDARKLQDGFSSFTRDDLQSLGLGEAIVRVGQANQDFNLRTEALPKMETALAKERIERIVALSRQRYAARRSEIEPEVLAKSAVPLAAARVTPTLQEAEAPVRRMALQRSEATASDLEERPRPRVEIGTAGRGGHQHKYLQQLMKQVAEERGYRATIEESLPDGSGRVDVSLVKGDMRIACEISITSTPDQELANIKKCIAAGYGHVLLICPDKTRLKKLEKSVRSKFYEEIPERVAFLLPDLAISYLDQLEISAQTDERTVRGYRVKVTHQPVEGAEGKTRRDAIAHVILRSLKHLAGDK